MAIKDITQPLAGSLVWDVPLNANFAAIDNAFGLNTVISTTTGTFTLDATQVGSLSLQFTGVLVGNLTANIPIDTSGTWIIRNDTSGAFDLTIGSIGGGDSVVITQGEVRTIYCDAVDVVFADTPFDSIGSNGQVIYNDGGVLIGSELLTFDDVIFRPGANKPISSITCAGTTATATFTDQIVIPVGSYVTITGASVSGYNGIWQVTSSAIVSGTESYVRFIVPSTLATAVSGTMRYGTVHAANLMLNGNQITAMASEINLLDGVTAIMDPDDDTDITGGITSTSVSDGTPAAASTYTPDPSGGNFRSITNDNNFTIAAPSASGCYTMVIRVTNSGTPGTISTSGFNRVTGSAFTTTASDEFLLFITKFDGDTFMNVVALQ